MKSKEKIRNNKGITLIALVITIIVLLILAGVSIAMLTGENGLLIQTQRAKANSEVAEAKELAAMKITEQYAEFLQEKYSDTSNNSQTFTPKDFKSGKYEIKDGKITITPKGMNENGEEVTISGTVNEGTGIIGWTENNEGSKTMITFTINGDWSVGEDWNSSCSAEEEMTWGEWVESEYNTNNLIVKENSGMIGIEGTFSNVAIVGSEYVSPSDRIIANCTYCLTQE